MVRLSKTYILSISTITSLLLNKEVLVEMLSWVIGDAYR